MKKRLLIVVQAAFISASIFVMCWLFVLAGVAFTS